MNVKVGDIIKVVDSKKAFNGPSSLNGIETRVTRVENYGIYTEKFGLGIYLNQGSYEIKNNT